VFLASIGLSGFIFFWNECKILCAHKFFYSKEIL
jgi:hypothetical protein